jgi:hypothetical protein
MARMNGKVVSPENGHTTPHCGLGPPCGRVSHILSTGLHVWLTVRPNVTGRLELAGEPFPVAEQVGSTISLGYFAVSANGVLAYRTGATAGAQLTWLDREGKALANLGPPESYPNASSAEFSI